MIPASFFFEWPKEGKPPKQPYAIELSNGGLFAFAGLWDAWKDKDGHWLQSYAIVGERLFRDGFRYAKCGVMITELLPDTVRQPALWGELDRERRERVWRTMDKLNATLGRDTVRILGAGPKHAAWNLRAEYRSPR